MKLAAPFLAVVLIRECCVSIDKWDGKLPTYSGGGALPFIDIGK